MRRVIRGMTGNAVTRRLCTMSRALCLLGASLSMPAYAQDEAEQPRPEAPVIEPDADVQTLTDEESDDAFAQAARESELASARRFEAELEALLNPDGQLNTALGDDVLTQLVSLATRCGILANNAMHDETRLVLLGYQARSLAALASLGPGTQEEDVDYLEQLGEVAKQIDTLDLPGAGAAADYWGLIADIAGKAPDQETPSQRQAYAEWALARYIEANGDDAAAAEYLLDTRLSLAQLMDRRGAQRDAAGQLKLIGELPPESPRLQEIELLTDSIARLGTPLGFESISTELVLWRSSDHLGKPVLIHVYSDGVDPSVRMIDAISRSIVEGKLSGIAVVSLRVGEPIATTASPPWPTLPVQLEPEGVLDRLGVTALPTLAWLDEQGRLASIGTTPAVLEQLASIKAATPDEPEEEQPTEPQPEEQTGPEPDEPDQAPADPAEDETP